MTVSAPTDRRRMRYELLALLSPLPASLDDLRKDLADIFGRAISDTDVHGQIHLLRQEELEINSRRREVWIDPEHFPAAARLANRYIARCEAE